MEFRISDTFTDSLARLTRDEQKLVKTTAFDLQLNPSNPGHQFHRLDRARDRNFWSVRVGADVRLIVHRMQESLLLCYVDHHDKAYAWAEHRKLEVHPRTGAAQLVEIRERVIEQSPVADVKAPKVSPASAPKPAPPRPLLQFDVETLLGYGVPAEWADALRAATEDDLLTLADHLPAEAAEAVLELATGGVPTKQSAAPPDADPFQHPDAQRRFRLVANVEALEQAFAYPWDKWTVFLHPDQRALVERSYNGPARVSGSAGTGKTIVALHRAVHLARSDPDARVLLTTFSDALANALAAKLRRLVSTEPKLAERIEVSALDTVGERLFSRLGAASALADDSYVRDVLTRAATEVGDIRYSLAFLWSEWRDVVDAWQLGEWDAYRDVKRLGRKTRLPEAQRAKLWQVFERVQKGLVSEGRSTRSARYGAVARFVEGMKRPPFEYVVVDECQDVSIPQLRLLAALGGQRPNALFFAGDLGQRIFQPPFSWKSMGVDVRGRSRTLHVNYRTSHQIRSRADRLLDEEISDVDGNVDFRKGTVSVFNGPVPEVHSYLSEQDEIWAAAAWLRAVAAAGFAPHEFGVFVRSDGQIERARAALELSVLPYRVLDERVDTVGGAASLCSMHLAKGLEFRAVLVMACDDEVIPSQERISEVTDESDLEEVYNTERHLLYVACTRARERLWVSGVEPESEFLADLTYQPAEY